jgi:hypothetical protein
MSQQQHKEKAGPAPHGSSAGSQDTNTSTSSSSSSSEPLDFSDIDFSKPEACSDLKEEHDQCFHVWLVKFIKGEAQTDECKPAWERYRACTAVHLATSILFYFILWSNFSF